ncbi:MAG: hypothetical protein ABI811_18010 [Acidobacteriota bacterium]
MHRFSLSVSATTVLVMFVAALSVSADTKKLSQEQRRELLRGLTAEWATAKIVLPVSKKPLPFDSLGTWDEAAWKDANYKNGPAARPGDMVQITKVDVDDDKITLQFNDGSKKGSFLDHVQIGGSAQTAPLSRPKTNSAAGTSIQINFPDSIGTIDAAGVKKILAGALDFDKHSAVETYIESLPAPIQEAIKAQKVIPGMDREQVLMSLGPALRHVRETKDDVDYEEWIYGRAPGVIKFIKFAGAKVDSVKEYYAGINGNTVEPGSIK